MQVGRPSKRLRDTASSIRTCREGGNSPRGTTPTTSSPRRCIGSWTVTEPSWRRLGPERTPSAGATCSSENSIRTSPDHAPLPGSSRLWLASPTTWISIAPGTTTASSKRRRHSVRPGGPSQSRGTEDLKSSGASLPPRKPRHVKFGRGRPPSGGRELCVALEPGEDGKRPPTRRGPSEPLAGDGRGRCEGSRDSTTGPEGRTGSAVPDDRPIVGSGKNPTVSKIRVGSNNSTEYPTSQNRSPFRWIAALSTAFRE